MNKTRTILALFLSLSLPQTSHAISVDEDIPLSALLEMDISELMDIEVNIASRSKERLFTTPAATYVITQEDIKRSGLRSIPELLRLVPGFHVGHIDANKWAISSREGATLFSGNMLVLMDGRTLYSPLSKGTHWDVQDTLLEDIEHIEIIRGPGGSIWGANAVNGVINIITKSAVDTQDAYVYLGGGKGEIRSELGFRQGFKLSDDTHGRIYAKKRHKDHGEYMDITQSNNNGFFPVGDEAYDDGQYAQAGFRLDTSLQNNNTFTLQGDLYQGKSNDIRKSGSTTDENDIDTHGFNLIAKWKHPLTEKQSLTTTAYIDVTDRQDEGFNDRQETVDLDVQHDIQWGKQYTSWGVAARYHADDTSTGNLAGTTVRPRLNLDPPAITDHLYQLFIQNKSEIIDDKLFLTLGSKFENNDYSGNEHHPSARLSYLPNDQYHFWLASSRSARSPTRGDQDLYLDYNDALPSCAPFGPGSPTIIDPQLGCIIDARSTAPATVTTTKELGYRGFLNDDHMIDVSLFYQTFNGSNNHNKGIEIITRHQMSDQWKLEYWYAQHLKYIDTGGVENIDQSVQTPTMHLRSYWNITPSFQFDFLAYYVPEKRSVSGATLLANSYTRLDSHLSWKLNKKTNIDLVITNLNDDVHSEEREDTSRVNTGVKRGFFIKMDHSF